MLKYFTPKLPEILPRVRKKVGEIPGKVTFTGVRKMEEPILHILCYGPDHCEEKKVDLNNIPPPAAEGMTWYDLRGLHDEELIERIGDRFKLHPLIREDIVDTQQRPKYDEYEHGVFIILRSLSFDDKKLQVKQEHIGIYFEKNFVISFQEDVDDVFSGVRERLLAGSGRIRKRGADYLAYALMDNIVDGYFQLTDSIETIIDKLEAEITDDPSQSTKANIHRMRRELLTLRKSISPLREVIGQFMKSENRFIAEGTSVFVRDLYDHTLQVMEMVETYRDTLSGLQDLYLSEISFKMNSVMQVLTIISTIFIPLTFLCGLYGMNFEYIPELHYRNGYFILLGVMGSVTVLLLFYFKRRDWL